MPVILVVDDDTIRVSRIATALERAVVETEAAACGCSGLEAAVQLEPNLILCAEELPDFNAPEFLEIKRDEPKIADIPVMVYSANSMRKLSSYKLGADDFIILPDEEEELVLRVRRLLRRAPTTGVSGDFSHLDILDLIQMLVAARRDGFLDIDCGDVFGTLCFREGQVIHASSGDEEGEEAFLSLLRETQRGGSFNFVSRTVNADIDENITKRTDHLLLGLANALDEEEP